MATEMKLDSVWRSILEIYGEVAKICDRHGLRYYLTDGTAIGAVRHSGFIPWDDDFDMSMPREDYEKFIVYANEELPSHLKFLNWKNCSEFNFLFGKVQDCRREKVESVEKECGYMLSNGLYIDILPIDGYPESKFERMIVKTYAYLLRALWRAKFGVFRNQSRNGKILCIFGHVFSFFVPWIRKPGQIMSRCEKMLRRHPFEGAKFTSRASVYLTGLNRPPLPVEWWGDAVWKDFMNIKVPLPHDYDSYLRFYYGDYMKLPPEEQRKPSHGYKYRCGWWLGPTRRENK